MALYFGNVRTTAGLLTPFKGTLFMTSITLRVQKALVYWALLFLFGFGVAMVALLHMVPLPPATLDASEVAHFYRENGLQVRLGAMVGAWTGGFMVPLAVVISVQMARMEKGTPVLAMLQLTGGGLMSVFLAFPPVFWGVAAFTPERPAEITQLIHEVANLTFIATNQFVVFQYAAIAAFTFLYRDDALSPFPCWFGYLTVWIILILEVGSVAFLTKAGPFAWNGLFVFWVPFTVFFWWLVIISVLLLRTIKRQNSEAA